MNVAVTLLVDPAIDRHLELVVSVLAAEHPAVSRCRFGVVDDAFGDPVVLATDDERDAVHGDRAIHALLEIDRDRVLGSVEIGVRGVDQNLVDDLAGISELLQIALEVARLPGLLDAVVDGGTERGCDEILDVGSAVLCRHTLGQNHVPQGLHDASGRDVIGGALVIVIVVSKPYGEDEVDTKVVGQGGHLGFLGLEGGDCRPLVR